MEQKLIVSSSPHLGSGATTQKIMLDVIIALIPAAIASCILFGIQALILILTCVISCVLAEYLSRKVMKRDNTIFDLSAVVTGLLLAFNLPATINPLIAVFGSVVAIVVVKQMFGGIGQNFMNPALSARCFMLIAWSSAMTNFTVQGVSSATPMTLIKTGGELPAMVMIDAISRMVPGVLKNEDSGVTESFQENLLEYPQYTRPEVWEGKKVPDILLSGHHANVEKWRREQSIIRTLKNRPELLEDAVLSKKEQKFLYELLRQQELENAQKVKNKEKAAVEHDGEETV